MDSGRGTAHLSRAPSSLLSNSNTQTRNPTPTPSPISSISSSAYRSRPSGTISTGTGDAAITCATVLCSIWCFYAQSDGTPDADQIRMQLLRHLHDRPRRIATRHRMIHRQPVRFVERRQKPQPLQAVRALQMPPAPRQGAARSGVRSLSAGRSAARSAMPPRNPSAASTFPSARTSVASSGHPAPPPESGTASAPAVAASQSQRRTSCARHRLRPQHQQRCLMVAQRKQDPLAHNPCFRASARGIPCFFTSASIRAISSFAALSCSIPRGTPQGNAYPTGSIT